MSVPALVGGVLVGQSPSAEHAVLGADADPRVDGIVFSERVRGGTLMGRARGRRVYGCSEVEGRKRSSVGLEV